MESWRLRSRDAQKLLLAVIVLTRSFPTALEPMRTPNLAVEAKQTPQ